MGSAPSPETNYPVVFRIFLPLLQASSRLLPYIRPGRFHSALFSIHYSPLTRTLDVNNNNNKYIVNREALLNAYILYGNTTSKHAVYVSGTGG